MRSRWSARTAGISAAALLTALVLSQVASAGTILSGYDLIDLSSGSHNANQTVWTASDGTTVAASDLHWSNGSLYYVGYMVDSSYTYDHTTGVFENGPISSAIHGYLSNSADQVTVTVTFPEPKSVSLMRFYPMGWQGRAIDFVTDYSVSYRDGEGQLVEVIARQSIDPSDVPEGETNPRGLFFDHDVNVTATEWQVTLTNGQGAWQGNATFNEVQFFESDTFFASGAVPEPSVGALALLGLCALRRRRGSR